MTLSTRQYFLGSADMVQPRDWVFQSPLWYLQTCQGETRKGTSHLLNSYVLQPGLEGCTRPKFSDSQERSVIGLTWASVLPPIFFLKGDNKV